MREKERFLERETKGGGGSPWDKKRGGHADMNRKRKVAEIDSNTIPFFFTNFSDDCLQSDLWKVFLQFCKVMEVYVAKKLYKRGHRFGFVKFLEVDDEEALGSRFEDVWIGDRKLKVNKARFGRDTGSTPAERRRKDVVDVSGGGGGADPLVVTYRNVVANVRVQKPSSEVKSVLLFPSEERLKIVERCSDKLIKAAGHEGNLD